MRSGAPHRHIMPTNLAGCTQAFYTVPQCTVEATEYDEHDEDRGVMST